MPKITVITTTYRPWNRLLDQAKDLEAQQFKDFEWIVVDDLLWKRDSSPKTIFPLLHTEPKGGVVDYFAPARADNTALAFANGELVYFMNDYIRLTPSTLSQHWAAYQKYGPRAFFAGQLVPMDGEVSYPLRKGEVVIGPQAQEAFSLDSAAVWTYAAGRNDSAPLAALLEINGLDEDFDGDRGGSDVDLAQRLIMAGLRYILLQDCIAFEYAHHAVRNVNYAWEKELPRKGSWDRIVRGYRPAKVRAEHKWDIAKDRHTGDLLWQKSLQ